MDFANLAADPNTLVMGYNGRVEQFTRSPLHPRARASAMRWMFSSLLRFDENINLVGDLARRWERSADGRTLTFHLRRDAVWHDGRPVTADDVVYSAGLLKRPTAYFRNTLHLSTGEPVEFAAPDPHTVTVTTPRPFAALPAYLTGTWAALFLIVPRHVVEAVGEDAFERNPVGSGPFRFGRIGEDHATLEANPSYFAGKPRLQTAVLRMFAVNEARIEAFRRGELDLVVAPGRALTRDEAARFDGRLESIPSNQVVQFALNGRHPILKSVKVRQAIAHAVDRAGMVHEIEGPDALPAFGPVGPTCWAYEPEIERPGHDPALSARLLAEEGWAPGADGIMVRGTERLAFSVIYVPDAWNVDYPGFAAYLRRHLRAVGIDLTVRAVEYWSGMKSAWRRHDFGAFMYHDTFYNDPDLYWSWHSSMPRRPEGPESDAPAGLPQYGYGVTGYSNPRVDELVVRARETVDPGARRRLLSEVQKILAREVASLWLFNFPYRSLVHNRLRGLSPPSLADGSADLTMTPYPERLFKTFAGGKAG